jgi:response regulator RpfG family c-di-GMP phosphodiesterase
MNEAVKIMKSERGRHFDPDLLDNFFSSLDSIIAVKSELTLV